MERSTYQAYGGAESTYRPERWGHFREDYRFTGKEEDVEVGLVYFGKRFYNPLLQRWVSADPLEVHNVASGEPNVYAYVSGKALKAIDPLGPREASDNTKQPYQKGASHARTVTRAAIKLDNERRSAEALISKSHLRDTLRNVHDPDKREAIRTKLYAEYEDRLAKATQEYDNAVEHVLRQQYEMPQESNEDTALYLKGFQAGAAGERMDDAIKREVGKTLLTSLATGGIMGAMRFAAGLRAAVLSRSAQNATRVLRLPRAVGTDVNTIRLRHFTRTSSLKPIKDSNVLLAVAGELKKWLETGTYERLRRAYYDIGGAWFPVDDESGVVTGPNGEVEP